MTATTHGDGGSVLDRHIKIVLATMNTSLTKEQRIAMLSMGLAGEVGEVIEPLKKHLFHGKPIDTAHLMSEAGDVLWYLNGLLITLGSSVEEAMEHNIKKLSARYPGGFVPGGGIRG
jgi:NTP pyrophosphatase (non-canonical NTP hydrolase)